MTKEQILSQISQEDIIKNFFPDFNSKSNRNYKSPFAGKDDKPSLNFYFDDQTLKFKSHNTGHQGDVFQFIADLNGIDCKANPKTLFSSLSVRVVCAFGLITLLSVFYIVRFLQLAAFGSETPLYVILVENPYMFVHPVLAQ